MVDENSVSGMGSPARTFPADPALDGSRSGPGWQVAPDQFVFRHIGSNDREILEMARLCGYDSLDALIGQVVPPAIRMPGSLGLAPAQTEAETLAELRDIARQNRIYRSYLGMGYHACHVPPVLQRNILENPGWYTQYTPYQAEIAQGRLEALLNFQTMVCDLTGLEVANASLLDEGTAAAEAMMLCHHAKGAPGRQCFLVSDQCHPQTIEVVRTRAEPLGIQVRVKPHLTAQLAPEYFGALVQYPATSGTVEDLEAWCAQVHAAGALVVVATDLLALTLLKPPGEFGADAAVGNSQRFGVPMGFGGPHAAFFATRDAFKRLMPGRLVGVSKDSRGRPAIRLALQTREQHIRREKATSNICTAQVLLAIMAAMYAIYHGPEGLRRIARRVHGLARTLSNGLVRLGHRVENAAYFDTIQVRLGHGTAGDLQRLAEQHRVNLRVTGEQTVGIALDETTNPADLELLWRIFNRGQALPWSFGEVAADDQAAWPGALDRRTPFLAHPVFNQHHSETEMLRYLTRLESRDLSLTTSMIPLGSCTMKLNAAAEMYPITWAEFGALHPFAPAEQCRGYQVLFRQLEQWLAEITGFDAVSLQPNAGSQGEYAGLMVIRKYHESRGGQGRDICLIPQSAHGTNPASAVMAGFKVVPVICDASGNIDLGDLRAKADLHAPALGALMITYPSTHGVFEEQVQEICREVHARGGQVYMDGANMNAQVGLCQPARIGADVCHLNLHKTFSIPHGGGGPGMGPICVARHLAPFLPGHPVVPQADRGTLGAISAAPWGSASILPISWAYIKMMGAGGLAQATKVAILNANYVAARLNPVFPVLYKGQHGLVAHECILDFRMFKSVTVEDVAKRLMDYGFHAPTISWPVPGTIMVEPTESESKAELDRFCEAMIAIHAEMQAVESNQADRVNNVLKHAPHTADQVASGQWNRPYTREQAAYPAPWLREHKFWPAVGRIDNVHGDRNPICTCAGMDQRAG